LPRRGTQWEACFAGVLSALKPGNDHRLFLPRVTTKFRATDEFEKPVRPNNIVSYNETLAFDSPEVALEIEFSATIAQSAMTQPQ